MNQNIIIENVDMNLLETQCTLLSMVLNREDLLHSERQAIECILDTLAEAKAMGEEESDYKKKYEQLLNEHDYLRDEFHQYKRESIKWSAKDLVDFNHSYYSINDDQAQAALETMIARHDASIGINWDTVDFYIQEFGTRKIKTS